MRARLCLATACVLVGVTALAYTTIDSGGVPARWQGARCVMYYEPSWSQSSPQFIPQISAALSKWSAVSGSNFVFYAGGSSPSANVRDTTNGINDTYWDNLSASAFAVTYVVDNGVAIRDRDVAFNTAYSWTTDGLAGPDFQTVAVHEYGHVLGLGHESTSPAVMYPYYNGTGTNREPKFDDEEGCRFLYPAPTPPPAPPSDADLVLDSVAFGPPDAGSGDEITIDYSMRNVGTADTGTFAVTAYLTEDTAVTAADRYLGARIQASIVAGGGADGSLTVTLPDLPKPRLYRVGVVLDAQGATGDRHPENNSGVASRSVQGGGDAVEIGPGYRVTGRLIPFGRESFVMELSAGTRLDMRADVTEGSLALSVCEEESGVALTELLRYRRARSRLKIPADGRYLVYIDSQNANVTPYELRVGAKTIHVDGEAEVGAALRITLPGYLGARVRATVRSRGDLRPTAEWVGIEAAMKRNKKGTKVMLADTLVPITAPLVLALSQGDGPVGEARYRVRMTFPKKGPLLQR